MFTLKIILQYLGQLRATCYKHMAVVFISFLLIARRWRNPTSSFIDILDTLFLKNLKYFDPGAIYRNNKAHSLTNKFRKPVFVLFLCMYMNNVMMCK
jgi:hypothetical protein